MRILLVNPNRYRTPPTPPLALEYLDAALSQTRHECRVLDLCFSEDVAADVRETVAAFRPDVVGLTVRNIDTVLMPNNVFFLDEIRAVVERIRSSGLPVIAGGAGFSFAPEDVRDYLGVDFGVAGPGERALPALLDRLERETVPRGTIVDGWRYGVDLNASTRRAGVVDYTSYLREGGLLGFETQKGCLARCPYCREGQGRVMFKNPVRVVEELRDLAHRGWCDLHLCDTEFNQDLAFCHALLQALVHSKLELRWAVYMKTTPYDEALFRLMRAGGVHLITISHPTGPRGLEHLGEIRRLTRKYEIRLAIDYLCGLPGDTLESVRRTIAELRRIQPDTVGVNSALRLYPGLALTDRILTDPQLRVALTKPVGQPHDCVQPVFWQQITPEQLRDIIRDDPQFRIEGFQRTTNYQRV
jgi:hypothetical protein